MEHTAPQHTPRVRRIAARHEGMKKRVAAYARVSTLADNQEESFETQVNYYTSYIQANPNWEFVKVYADQGKSGTSAKKRPDFNRMINAALAGEMDIILVKSISRFSRNIVDCQRYVTDLKEAGVEVRFEKEGISSFDASSEFIFSVLAAVAQEESHSISENVKWAVQQRFARGEYCLGDNRILGYDTAPETKKLIPNEDAWIIRYIFSRFIEGAAYQAIADELNDMNARCMTKRRHRRSKAVFSPHSIRAIVYNETYVGDKLLQKNAPVDFLTKCPDPTVDYDCWYVENDHEGIIDRETWTMAQAITEQRAKEIEQGIHMQGKDHHVFFGKVFCGECGSVYKRRTFSVKETGGKRYYHAWNCRERQKGKNGNGCKNNTLQEKVLEELICSELGWTVFSDERFNIEVERVEVTGNGIRVLRRSA